VERVYFFICRVVGWLLRSARYSSAQVISRNGTRQVRKRRAPYAPLLIWIASPLVRVLDTGVRVLHQREWESRERLLYDRLYEASVEVEPDGTLVLPFLAAATLASVLENAALDDSMRADAVSWAVTALASFHRLGFSHGDAMAENVLIDLESGTARLFDFETVHDPDRPLIWRRADDLRALLFTCVIRTAPEKRAAMIQRIVSVYGDDEVVRVLTTNFTAVFRRALAFHLAQAGLSFDSYREIARLLRVLADETTPRSV
jgi:hypothetical protein